MMISAPSAGDPYSAAAALERQLRTPATDADAGGVSSDGGAADASPDVVVTLSSGPSSPATYNAAGKFAATPTLDDTGANAPDSLAHASESVTDDPTPSTPAPADADQEAVPA
jgi:hypothetical protein